MGMLRSISDMQHMLITCNTMYGLAVKVSAKLLTVEE